jgi:hypothetical protein
MNITTQPFFERQLSIESMTCGCGSYVEEALRSDAGVQGGYIHLSAGRGTAHAIFCLRSACLAHAVHKTCHSFGKEPNVEPRTHFAISIGESRWQAPLLTG